MRRDALEGGQPRTPEQPRIPGEGSPEIPRKPPPGPELPGRTGAPPGREIPAIPRPAPEEQPLPRRRPDAPMGE